MSVRSDLSRGALASLTLALVLASSCTLTRTKVDSCSQNSDCRGAFGVGRICGSDGLCEAAAVSPRCTTTFPADVLTRSESYPGVLLVGSLMDRSVESQRARENAIRLAATQVNEAKGVDGHLFGIVFCDVAESAQYDSAKRTDAAVASAQYLANVVGVSAIVGPSSSTDALAVFGAVKDLDVLVISPAATSPALTGADVKSATDDVPGLLWRTAPPDTLQGAAIVRHLRGKFPTVKGVALVQEKGAYGDALTQVFTDGFAQEGRTVTPFPYSTSSERDAAIVAAGAAATPIVLFFSSQTADGIAFLNAAQSLPSYSSTTLFLTDSAANKDLLSGAAGAAAAFPRVIGSRPAVPQGPTFELFKTSYTAAFKQDPNTFSFVPHSYDATWLAFYGTARALRRDKRVTGHGIARGLRSVSDQSPEVAVSPAKWAPIIDALGSGGTVNLVGASGSLDYDPTTEETTGLVDIWKISADAKTIETVTTIDPR
ncbi:MAG TPA: ABC transporter substrate-binding protein [Labilithrix sp.]|nr:ABC transporter substrate-binding protein [Labilithrix sp.]